MGEVQRKTASFTGATSVSATFDSAVTDGNTILAFIFLQGSTTAPTWDSETETAIGGFSISGGGNGYCWAAYLENYTGGAEQHDFTVPSSDGHLVLIEIDEVPSSPAIQSSNDAPSGAGTTVDLNADAVDPTNDDSIAYAMFGGWNMDATNNATNSADSGWTEIEDLNGVTNNSASMGVYTKTVSDEADVDGTGTISTGSRRGAVTIIIEQDAGGAQAITPAAETVDVTAGTLTLDMHVTPAAETVDVTAGTLSMSIDVVPSALTVTATPGTLTITVGAVDITPAATTVTITAGTLTLAIDLTPAATTVTATPGTLTVDLNVVPDATTVTATPGTLTVELVAGDQDITPAATTVTITAGTLTLDMAVTPAATTVTATPGTLSLAVDVVPDPTTVTITAGTLTLDLHVVPSATTVTATPGTLTVTTSALQITPDPTTVGVTPGTLTLAIDLVPAATTVTITAGTVSLAVDLTPDPTTVTATPGTLALAIDLTPGATTVTATPGTLTVAGVALAVTPDATTITVTAGTLIIAPGAPADLGQATEAANFYRYPSTPPRLHLGIGPRRSMTVGYKSNEGDGWEVVSEQFKMNGNTAGIDAAQACVAVEWDADKNSAAATLKAAIDARLQAAGYRRLDGSDLT